MRTLLLLLVAIISFNGFACKKDHKTIYKAKYLDKSCFPIIQIVEPSDNPFKESVWEKNDSTYTGAVSVLEVPEKDMDGREFSITISEVREGEPMRDDCTRPKYYIIVDEWLE